MLDSAQQLQITLTIKQIHLLVKFPCKLTLIYQGTSLKSSISSQQNKYQINEQLKIKLESQKNIQIFVHLTTDKGGNIMAGLIKLQARQLKSAQGTQIKVGMHKCLDSNACCFIKVHRVFLIKVSKAKSSFTGEITKNRKSQAQNHFQTSAKKVTIVDNNMRNIDIRSQLPIFDRKRQSHQKRVGDSQRYKKNQTFCESVVKNYPPSYKAPHQQVKPSSIQSKRTTLGQQKSHYIQNYNNPFSLQKELQLQKQKSQQSCIILQQKQYLIKQLKEQINELEQLKMDKSYIKEELNNKQLCIKKLDEQLKQQAKQNYIHQSRIIQLECQLQHHKRIIQELNEKHRKQYDSIQYQNKNTIINKNDQITSIKDQLNSKNNQIMRLKIIIEDLQANIQQKNSDHERALYKQKAQLTRMQTSYKQKLTKLQTKLTSNLQSIHSLQQCLIAKTTQTNHLNQTIMYNKTQLTYLSSQNSIISQYEIKLSFLQKQLQSLRGQKDIIEKNYQVQRLKHNNQIQQIRKDQQSVVDTWKNSQQELVDRNKLIITKNKDLDYQINQLTSLNQKLTRTIQYTKQQLINVKQHSINLTLNIKQKDEKIIKLQNQLTQQQQIHHNTQVSLKKDVQQKCQLLTKQIKKQSKTQQQLLHEKQTNQNLRYQLTKHQGHQKLQQQKCIRLIQQLNQMKLLKEKKQNQSKQQLKQYQERIKTLETNQKGLNKYINQRDIQIIITNNQIIHFKKDSLIKQQKIKKYQNQIHYFQQQIKAKSHQILLYQQNIRSLERELNEIHNGKITIQANFNKNQKIKQLILDEKSTLQSQVLILKKQILRKDGFAKQLQKQIRQYKDSISSLSIKLLTTQTQFKNFKQQIHMSLKNSFHPQSLSPQSKKYPLIATSSTISINTPPRRQHQNSILKAYQTIPNLIELTQHYGKQSQHNIKILNQKVYKQKIQLDKCEKQVVLLRGNMQLLRDQAGKLKTIHNQDFKQIKRISQQHINSIKNKLQQKQKLINNYQKDINNFKSQVEHLNQQLVSQNRQYQLQLQELGLKQQQLKQRLNKSSVKNDEFSLLIVSYQEKIFIHIQKIQQLQSQLQNLQQTVLKKDNLLSQVKSQAQQLNKASQQLKEAKFSIQKDYTILKQKNLHNQQQNTKQKIIIKELQQNYKLLKDVNITLTKEKQQITHLKDQQRIKVLEFNNKIKYLQSQKQDLSKQLIQLNNLIKEQQSQLKVNVKTIKDLELARDKSQRQIQKLLYQCKSSQKLIHEKQLQLKSTEVQFEKQKSSQKQQISRLQVQHNKQINKQRTNQNQLNMKILQLQNSLRHQQSKFQQLNQKLITLQQQLFFQKQTTNLTNSRYTNLQQSHNQLQQSHHQLIHQINQLNQEVRFRQERLFQLSSKMHQKEKQIQNQQQQHNETITRLQINLTERYKRILDQYQTKIQLTHNQKIYLKNKIQQIIINQKKSHDQKRTLKIQYQNIKRNLQDKLKKIQNQKLLILVQKNKLQQKLVVELQSMQAKLLSSQRIITQRQQKQSHLQSTQKQLVTQLSTQQSHFQSTTTQLSSQITLLKSSISHHKKYKQDIKNYLWNSQREIRKILQSGLKSIFNICGDHYNKEIGEVLRGMENGVSKTFQTKATIIQS